MMLHVRGLSYRATYQGHPIVHDFDYDFSAGKLYVLRGENGSGKTTLLQLLAGLHAADEGDILWQKKSISDPTYPQQVLWMGHHLGLSLNLTVHETLTWFTRVFPPLDRVHTLSEVIDLLNLKSMMHQRVGECSAGQKRRVSLARLWLCPRPICLLDEPDVSLDEQVLKYVEKQIHHLLKEQTLVILSTHQSQIFHSLSCQILESQDWGNRA